MQEIKEIKQENLEALYQVFKDLIEISFRYAYTFKEFDASLLSYGKQYFEEWKKEEKILKYLSVYQTYLNDPFLSSYFSYLDTFFKQRYSWIDNIFFMYEEAIETHQKQRIVCKPIPKTICLEKEYETIFSSFPFERVLKDYLLTFSWKEKTLETVKEKITYIEDPYFFGVYGNDPLTFDQIHLCVPKMKDIKTFLVNLHEYLHAYYIYLQKHEMDEHLVRQEENKFIKKYRLTSYLRKETLKK